MTHLWPPDQYALLDFGVGRKLESFAGILLDRPSPAADGVSRSDPALWHPNRLRVDSGGRPSPGAAAPPPGWRANYQDVCFHLKLTPFGHVGLFPEQAANWSWLSELLNGWNRAARPRLLNLFGYTGGTTLIAASAGAEVIHVDASAPAVNWARQNARDSQLKQAPIRWLVEDARKFVSRELRRGNQHDVIVMDPPTFGHGPQKQRWQIEADLQPLLRECIQLLSGGRAALLVTGHSESPTPAEVDEMIQALDPSLTSEIGRLQLQDRQSRRLDAGYFVRATRSNSC